MNYLQIILFWGFIVKVAHMQYKHFVFPETHNEAV